jgi:hypothetical protein
MELSACIQCRSWSRRITLTSCCSKAHSAASAFLAKTAFGIRFRNHEMRSSSLLDNKHRLVRRDLELLARVIPAQPVTESIHALYSSGFDRQKPVKSVMSGDSFAGKSALLYARFLRRARSGSRDPSLGRHGRHPLAGHFSRASIATCKRKRPGLIESNGTLLRSISPPPKAALTPLYVLLCFGAMTRRNPICYPKVI